MKAILYLRLSVTTEESTSLARQERDLRELAEREGWIVSEVLSDDGVSGAKERANAAHALKALRTGEADVLAVWKFDRWSRQGLGAVARLFDVIEARKESRRPALFVALQDGIRSDAASWRLHVSLVAEIGHIERENIKTRVKSAREYLRAERKHSGRLPYGYRSVPHPSGKGRALEINPEEAAIVRRMADMIFDGHSAYATARRLNDEGLLPRTAPLWTSALVTDQLKRDSLNGYMTHRAKGDSSRTRRPILSDDGLPEQVWPAILTPAESRELRVLLGRNSKWGKVSRGGVPRGTHLLSGLLACSSCGGSMRAGAGDRLKDGSVSGRYVCAASPGACARKVSVTARLIEAHITEEFLGVVGALRVVEYRETTRDNGELAEVEAAIRETTSAMADPDADIPALVDRLTRLRARREFIEATPAEPVVELHETGQTYREAWEARELPGRRALLGGMLTGPIVLSPAVRGSRTMDTARVSAPWRWDEPDYADGEETV